MTLQHHTTTTTTPTTETIDFFYVPAMPKLIIDFIEANHWMAIKLDPLQNVLLSMPCLSMNRFQQSWNMQSYNPEVTTYNILAKIMWKHNISRLSLIPFTSGHHPHFHFFKGCTLSSSVRPQWEEKARDACSMSGLYPASYILHTLQPIINVKSSCVQYVSLIPNIIHALECIQIHQHTVDVG